MVLINILKEDELMAEDKKDKMLDLIIFIYNQYQRNDFNFAESLISHNYDKTVGKIKQAYWDARKSFKSRLLDPIKIPADNVVIDYSAAFEKMTAKKITSIELNKYANNAKIAKEMLEQLHEEL